MMKMMGVNTPAPVAAPAKGDKRFKDEDWEQHFLFDFVKQSYLIAARHIHDTVSGAEGLDESDPARRSISSPASTSTPCRRPTLR